ncbi:MAG TPA: aminoacyl-tRNA hydrolase [Bacteroidia bacterium]|nr:aminoacyl-tRNA hydrolase [Bacteroidia bacterium]
MSKYLIVCLGNIGTEYENTRHNIGFKVADEMALEAPTNFIQERLAYRCELKVKGKILVVIKPTTYMNLSGKALNFWMQAEKIKVENILIITDDIALPFGTLRIKPKGSDGGHNGLKSIQETLGTDVYARLRFGVGSNFAKGRQVDYVLGEWSNDEKISLHDRIKIAAEMAKSFCTIGLQLTMTNFNNK